MLKKYNIALVPTTENDSVIKCAQYFSKISDRYQLGENSHPHVTLCQFHADEKEIDELWTQVCELIPEQQIYLEFKEFSCITFDNNIFWVSLMPDQRDILNEMHQIVANAIKSPINKSYDPHMTLINTKDSEYIKMAIALEKTYSPISDNFVLAIGECDSIGQLTKSIHICGINRSFVCSN